MKKCLIFALSTIMLLSCSKDKEPADKVLNPLEVNEITNLEILCQVWGLVKYHHPAFKKGSTLNADADLLELIPKIRKANTVTRNQILLDWITGLGAFQSSKASFDSKVNGKRIYAQTAKPDYIVDMSWIDNDLILGTKLSAELLKVRYAATSEGSKYIEILNDFCYFIEDGYASITDPSAEYRLLSLFRYWNIVEYFFPLKNFLPRHWNNVLTDNIPKFLEATGNLEYRKAVAFLVKETYDPQNFLNDMVPVFGNYIVPSSLFTVSVIENKLIVTTAYPYNNYNIKVGDEIVTIGGRSLSEIKTIIHEYFSVRSQDMLHSLVSFYATTTNNSRLSVSYLTNGELVSIDYPTIKYRDEPSHIAVFTRAIPVIYTLVEEGAIGYINGAYYIRAEAATMMNYLKDTKGIIIDLRGVQRENMNNLAYNYFTKSDIMCFDWGQSDPATPGILFRTNQSSLHYSNGVNYMTYPGKVVIIADETTREGEMSIMILQTIPGAITIGSQTCGAVVGSTPIVFPGNISCRMSSLHCRYYNGPEVQQNGVRIDIEVKPTIAGIKEGRDELYEKAVELILK